MTAEWLSFLGDELDGQLLDTLHGKWLEAKGCSKGSLTSQRTTRSPGSSSAGLAPGCDCDQAVVDFIELLSGDDMEPIGGIRLRVTDAHVLNPDVEPGNEPLVERLWEAYQQRHRDPDRLVRHQRVLLDACQSDRAARAPRKARAARNEPCPCGSGQMYKRCCMERDLGVPASSQR